MAGLFADYQAHLTGTQLCATMTRPIRRRVTIGAVMAPSRCDPCPAMSCWRVRRIV